MNLLRPSVLFRRGYQRQYYYQYCTRNIDDFPSTFEYKSSEAKWCNTWEQNGYYSPLNSDKDPFTIILPPPNVTGILHLGHSLTATIEDALARWYRMRGHPVVWIPGIDHAGIATQVVVEKYLQKTKGLSRHDLGREKFISVVDSWRDEKETVIREQLKCMGASLDWSRKFFTMSQEHSNAVTEAFVRLSERKLIYREKSIINWSPTLHSAISDIEVDYLAVSEKTELEVPGYDSKISFGEIMEFSYQLRNSDKVIVVASTRPETMLGDVAIAVHPQDTRYSHHIGTDVWHPFRKKYIPIIADSVVDMDFGTGALKITPAHDHLDFEVAERHNLEIIDVIDEYGNITSDVEQFQGMPRFVARDKILNELAKFGVLKGRRNHKMVVPRCSRSGDIIEYLLREQWFVSCKKMANEALEAVKSGNLKIDPAIHERTWYKYLENIRDWCVSRQLWWGHRIPAYLCRNSTESAWIVARTTDEALKKATEQFGIDVQVEQDNDVLDTWFSSALLPFSTMGWPNQTADFQKFYPLSMLETGHDILFFWVARMVMFATEFTGQLPFKEILLHGIICDRQGRKMSKSRGNVISPETIIHGISLEHLNEQAEENYKAGIFSRTELNRTIDLNRETFPNGIPSCGTDALRLTLCSYNIKNHDVNFDINDCINNKLFCNKIWQAGKYLLIAMKTHPIANDHSITIFDKWILSRLSLMVETVNEAFQRRNLHLGVMAIKQFFYHEFCDWYLEATKPGLGYGESTTANGHMHTLIRCLDVSLRAIAPIMPYLADELYFQLCNRISSFTSWKSLMEAPYPTTEEFKQFRDIALEKKVDIVWKVVSSIRRLISVHKKKSKINEVHIVVQTSEEVDLYETNLSIISGLCKMQRIRVMLETDYHKVDNTVLDVTGNDCSVYLILENIGDTEEIKSRTEKKILLLKKKLTRMEEMTSAAGYIAKARDDIKKSHMEKIDDIRQQLRKLRATQGQSH